MVVWAKVKLLTAALAVMVSVLEGASRLKLAGLTVRVKVWVASLPMPLWAVKCSV